MKNIIFLSVLSLFIFTSCGGDDDNGPQDSDGDGYSVNDDCDDNNAQVNPDAKEVCGDGIDNNCDGNVDEGCAIGDLIEGGVVFYIAPTPTDLDGDGTLDRGLVCALNDEPTLLSWGCSGTDLPSVPNVLIGNYVGPGAVIGDGMSNTNGILNDCPDAPAALACRSLGLDWFLPSINELKELYINRVAINVAVVANGGSPQSNLPSSYYWTSTEANSGNSAFAHQFSDNGNVGSFVPILETHVRAVRAFN